MPLIAVFQYCTCGKKACCTPASLVWWVVRRRLVRLRSPSRRESLRDARSQPHVAQLL